MGSPCLAGKRAPGTTPAAAVLNPHFPGNPDIHLRFGRLGGYDDVHDTERLGRDPAMGWIVGGHGIEGRAASTSQMGRFETELPATAENLAALIELSGAWIDKRTLALPKAA